MKDHQFSYGTKVDIASSIAIGACMVLMFVAIEMAAPVLAGVSAGVAAVTGVARVVTWNSKKQINGN